MTTVFRAPPTNNPKPNSRARGPLFSTSIEQRAIQIATFRRACQPMNFQKVGGLSSCERRLRRRVARGELADLIGVEPDEMAKLADIDPRSFGRICQSDFRHDASATGTVAPGRAEMGDDPAPEKIDRVAGESAAQQLDAQRASAATVAGPKTPCSIRTCRSGR